MTAAQHLLTGLIAALNDHNAACLHTFFAPDLWGQDCAQAGLVNSPEEASATLENLLIAFPDFTIAVQEIVAGNGSAAAFWSAGGTHDGAWMNVPPTGRRVQFQGVWMIQVKNGRIARFRSVWDVAGLLRGFGLLPDL